MKKTGALLWTLVIVTSSLIIVYVSFQDFVNAHIAEIGVNAIGAYLGFVGAAIIYLLQIERENDKAKHETLERHKEHLRYFAGVLADVIRYANNQADELDVISQAIAKQPSMIHQLALVASGSVDRLNRADNEAAFHAYNTLLTADIQHEANYKTILSQTDLLTARLAAAKQAFINYRDTIYDRQLKLKVLIQNIADETAFLLRNTRQNGQASAFKKYAPAATDELNELMLRYVGLNASLVPFEKYFEEFIEPLKHWLHNNDDYILLEGEVRQRSLNLVRLTKGASVSFNDLKINALDFVKAFDSQKLRIPSNNLEELLKELNRVSI